MRIDVEDISAKYRPLPGAEERESDDLKLVARALLPESITTGTKLKYEMMQYEIIKG